jgi:hypothetical protein
MRTTGPVAATEPVTNIDAAAYVRSYAMTPTSPARLAYAAPMPVASDVGYRFDAGDGLRDGAGSSRNVAPLGTAVGPGDTVLVGERWF